jgi:hypothetical protein
MSAVIRKITVVRADLSNKLLSAVWALPLGNSTDKFVLVALADYANEHGRCFPGIDALVKRTDLSKRAIYGALNRLKATPYLKVIHRHRHSSVFELSIPTVDNPVDNPVDNSESKVRQMHLSPFLGALGARLGAPGAPQSAPSAPRTSNYPSLNLRDAKSVSAEDRELEAHGQALCFRVRMTGESAENYRAAMEAHEEAIGSSAVFLLDTARRKRP